MEHRINQIQLIFKKLIFPTLRNMLTAPTALNLLYPVPPPECHQFEMYLFSPLNKVKVKEILIRHQTHPSPPRRRKSFKLKPGMAKLRPSVQGGRTSTPSPLAPAGTHVLRLGDVVVGVVTAQRGLAGHRQLGGWRWVVSKGHQVAVLLKASSCWGVAGFGGLLQVALLLDLPAHGGVPVVLDSIISSATEIPALEEFQIWAFPIQTGQWAGNCCQHFCLNPELFSPIPTTTDATPNFSGKKLSKKVREKEKWATVVYILFLSNYSWLTSSNCKKLII